MVIRIVLAEGHKVLRAQLRFLLQAEADVHVVGEAEDGDGALRLVEEQRPDVLLAAVTLPGPRRH